MFARWGTAIVRLRWTVLAAGLAVVLIGGVWGSTVFAALGAGGFDDPHSQAVKAQQLIDSRIGHVSADVVVLFDSPTAQVDQPAYRAAVERALQQLPPGVTRLASYWTTGSTSFVSADRHATFALISLRNPDQAIGLAKYAPLKASLAGTGLTARIGGTNAINADINSRVSSDLARAETLSMPILLVLLVIVFGSVVAALLPLAIGGLAILGSFTALKLISGFTEVSVFAINIVTILGLGLAIDYGLFIVDRFREERQAGHPTDQAISRTMATAGRTVAVSAITVASSLAGLTLFPQTFLRSMGFGGVAAVAVAAIGALTVLPALLAVLGDRVEALAVRPLLRRLIRRPAGAEPAASNGRFWYRVAAGVMRRPASFAVAVIALLGVLAVPFLHVSFGGIDARVLPAASETRQVSDALARDFQTNQATPIVAVLSLDVPAASYAGQASVGQYLQSVQALPGAGQVAVNAQSDRTVAIDIAYSGQPLGAQAKQLLAEVRALPRPAEVATIEVGGQTALIADRLSGLGSRLPWIGLLVALVSLLLLFLAFGSVLLPLKAITMNVLSLGASFGAITWIFQDGHLSGLLGFTSTGTVEATQPILVLAVIFGLSMDYEVFLLSRIREQYDLTGDNQLSLATGIQRTGRIITSAAVLLMVVIGAFSTSSITFIKLIGVAMLIAIAVDATLVRLVLVPATMRLLGSANWWAPRPLRRLYARYGIGEADASGAAARPAGLQPVG